MHAGHIKTKNSDVFKRPTSSANGKQKVPAKVDKARKFKSEASEKELKVPSKVNPRELKKLFKEAEYQLQCDICQEPQDDFSILKMHFRNEHNIDGYAMCCGYQITKQYNLIRHLKTHSNIKCLLCNQSYGSRLALAEHDEACKELFKVTKFKFECCICKVPQANFGELKAHFSDEHNNTRAYDICCGRKFSSRSHLIDHLNVHKNPNYFNCQICNKSYSSRRCLKKHLNIVHVVKQEKNLSKGQDKRRVRTRR